MKLAKHLLAGLALLSTSACIRAPIRHELPDTSLDKRMRRTTPVATSTAAATTPGAPSIRPAPLAIRTRPAAPVLERRLTNGARVLMVERHDFPSVAVSFVLDRGKCDDPAASEIYALALHGSSSEHDRRDNLSYLYFIAALYNSQIRDDSLALYADVLPPLLLSAVSRLAPIFFAPGLSTEDIEASRDLRKDNLGRASVRQQRLSYRTVRQLLFGPTGYGRVVVDEEELDRASNDAVRAFRNATLSPEHVTVIGVGDLKPDAFVAMLETYTKKLPRKSDVRPSTCGAVTPPPLAREIHVVDDPSAAQSQIAIGAVGAPNGHSDAPALDVLAAAMGASLSSRLNLLVREEHGWSYGVHMSSANWRTQGLVQLATSVETGRTADAIAGLLRELDRAADQPLDDGELVRAKLKAGAHGGTHRAEALELVEVAAHGLPADAAANRSRLVEVVTEADVRRVASRYLTADKRAIVVVGDAAKIEGSLRALGIGNVVVER